MFSFKTTVKLVLLCFFQNLPVVLAPDLEVAMHNNYQASARQILNHRHAKDGEKVEKKSLW